MGRTYASMMSGDVRVNPRHFGGLLPPLRAPRPQLGGAAETPYAASLRSRQLTVADLVRAAQGGGVR